MKGKIYRLIDANINRSLEGLRVIEDTARFILDDGKLCLKLKKMRHQIKAFSKYAEKNAHMLASRDIRRDVGKVSIGSEKGRANVLEVFKSNIKRLQESLRVLEEYSKLIDIRAAGIFKSIRYDVYDIEKTISPMLKKQLLLDFDLYVISDKPDTLKRAVKGGARAVQLRIKDKSRLEILRAAKKIARFMKGRATLIINDSPGIAKVVDADGVHMGQDISRSGYQSIRKMLGADKLIGASAYNMRQAMAAEKNGADYVGVGPVFKTPLKPEHKPIGLGLLRKIARRIRVPIVAIGGINASNIDKVINCGVKRTAAIRAISGKGNVQGNVRALRRHFT